ncbi:MAG: hypothetical protein UT38_C0006G0024 [Microgenomates group bacterium GW2011_GWA2_39_19]|nr:MAG: hypothetical protein UT38_C0006G0024 [Microgenomates group bacterium GW2011_GWA2_39_19]
MDPFSFSAFTYLALIALFGETELAAKLDRTPALKDRVASFGALTSQRRDEEPAQRIRTRTLATFSPTVVPVCPLQLAVCL